MENKRKFDEFDHFANDYREILSNDIKISGVNSEYFSEYKIKILKSEEKKEELIFLDFGCGDGNSATYFSKYFPKSYYSGVDISKKSISVAESRKLKNCNFYYFDGSILPFENETFDMVFTSCVFHHIDFKLHQNILKEINRVLKKKGRFYIFEHNPWNPVTLKIVNNCVFDENAVLLKPSYTKKTLLSLFNNQVTNYILFFPRHRIFNFFIRFEYLLRKIPLGGQYYTKAVKL